MHVDKCLFSSAACSPVLYTVCNATLSFTLRIHFEFYFKAKIDIFFHFYVVVFCYRLISFFSFGEPQLYNLEALSFTYEQYVVIEFADKLYNSVTLCESMNFHLDKCRGSKH